jgi:hypothetical protein
MNRTIPTVVLAFSLSLLLGRSVLADVFTWNDADGVWSDANAWQGNTAPPGVTPPDSLNFGTVAGGSNSTNDLGVASINGIEANTGAHVNNSVNLYGDTIGMSGANATITAAAGTQLGINNNVNLASNTGIGGNGGTVTINGQVTGAGGLTVNGAGTYVLNNGANSYGGTAVNAGTLVVNGTTGSGSVTVSGTGVLKGSGSVGALHVSNGGAISPGNSPGTMNAASAEFGGSGVYVWELNDFKGAAGSDPGWDLLSVSGQLNVTATAADPFTVKLTTLTLGDVAGSAANFNVGEDYSFAIATAAGGITGFNPGDFVLDLSGYQNPLANGFWSISQVGNNLDLNFTAVPEPSMAMLWSVGLALFGARYVLRKRANATPSV